MPAEGESTSSESPPAMAPGSTGPRRGGRRRWLLPVLAVVVVVVAVVAILFARGFLRFGQSNNSPSSPYETFSQAESTAQSGASAVPGGPWYASFGGAVSIPTAILEPTTNLSSLLMLVNCTFNWFGGEPENLGIPATGTAANVGAAAYWAFGLKNASNGLLLVTVSDGVATALLGASGPECSEAAGYLATFPAGIVDSPAAISAGNAVGGSAFLQAHPNATRVWGAYAGALIGLLGSTSPEWYIEYTTCTLP